MFNNIKLFDNFTFNARIMPLLTILFPYLFIIWMKGGIPDYWTLISVNTIAGIALIVVAFIFFVNIIRELGKRYEKNFNNEQEGMASTIILRYSDATTYQKKTKHTITV